jgi:hypothetical protein
VKPCNLALATVVAALACGCSAAQFVTPLTLDDPSHQPGYDLLAAPTRLAIAGASASSTLASTMPGLTLDDKALTAWRPAAGDASPALVLDLPGPAEVQALALRLSLGGAVFPYNRRVHVGVQAANGKTWTTIAGNLSPEEGSLQSFPLPRTTTNKLRLTFTTSGGAIGNLAVSDIQLTGAPSASPDGVPTSSAGCGRGTGAGRLTLKDQAGQDTPVTFRIAVRRDALALVGEVSLDIDPAAEGHQYDGRVTMAAFNGKALALRGTFPDGHTFVAQLKDGGTSPASDQLSITVLDANNKPVDTVSGPLDQGGLAIETTACL